MRQLAADFVQRESNQLSLITITRVMLSEDRKKASVLFTVLPEEKEIDAENFLKRKGGEFREYVKEHSQMRILPFFGFEIDKGEKNRQNLDMIG